MRSNLWRGVLVLLPALQVAELPKANAAKEGRRREASILLAPDEPHVRNVAVARLNLASLEEESLGIIKLCNGGHDSTFLWEGHQSRSLVTSGCHRFQFAIAPEGAGEKPPGIDFELPISCGGP